MPPKPDPDRWVVLGEPASPAEQAALTAFRNLLPSDSITRAWANLTFVDGKGRTGEVDVLLLSPVGFFLVELKGWHGEIVGTTQRWEQRNLSTHSLIRSHPNPYVAADSKAKRLSSILKDHVPNEAALRELPFLKSLVVLHGQDSVFAIDDQAARANVLALDGFRVTSAPGTDPLQTLSSFLGTPPALSRDDVTPRRASVVAAAMSRAQFLPTPKVRRFGQYEVTERTPIAEGRTWQDVLVENTGLGEKRRLRIFDLPASASEEDRDRIKADANREVALTRGLHHPGITAPLDFIGTDTGPALVFTYDDGERPLDSYLAERAANLTMDERMGLVRQLGDTLRYAHDRRLVHRSLSPRHVWIRPSGELAVRDWYAGQKRRSTTSTTWTTLSAGVADVASAVVQDDWLYLAPEAVRGGENLPGIPLDVYGFAALSALILTGRPPIANVSELVAVHQSDGGINLGAQDSLPEGVIEAVLAATRTTESERTASVREVLDQLESAWTVPAEDDGDAATQHQPPADPLAALRGDVVADRFEVVERRGEGSSGTAFVVKDFQRPEARQAILKVAKNDAAARRLDVEAEVLRLLRHPRIVALTEGPIDLGNRRALLLTDAGSETLSARIDREGRATIGQLETFGTDLIDLATYLDSQGIFHRDIKPANLGVTQDSSSRKRRITLFDFSLARESLDNVTSGTRGYLDPYLGRGARSRYDRAAELWSVAATLFELATGERPWWESGSGPESPQDAPVIAREAFEQSIAGRLVPFFTMALAPDARRRFGSIDDLRTAWLDVFAGLDEDSSARDGDDDAASRADLLTPLEASGLSARALSGLARTEAHTVGALLAVPATQINSIPGLGETYRKEIQRRIK
uniref:protein kinase domain-containing protein n=1 Tax=Miniimonas arenae TaxID=676201 RepID=UPI0028A97F56